MNTRESQKTRNRALMYLLDIYILPVISFLPFSYAADHLRVSLQFRLRFAISHCSPFRMMLSGIFIISFGMTQTQVAVPH